MSFEGPNSHPCTRKTGNADFLDTWVRQAQRVSSVANVHCKHLLLHHTVTLYPPIKFTQRPSLFARYALQNREEHFANFAKLFALCRNLNFYIARIVKRLYENLRNKKNATIICNWKSLPKNRESATMI